MSRIAKQSSMVTVTKLSQKHVDRGGELTDFAPSGFFVFAGRQLGFDTGVWSEQPGGDHVLNPDFARADRTYREAAVLIPVIAREPEVTVLLTTRTAHLPDHAGQIAFPGGKIDDNDPDPVVTALREAEEEIGLDRGLVEPFAMLRPYLSRTGFRVYPTLGRIEPGFEPVPNPQEVSTTFEVPIAFLMNPANHRIGERVFEGKPRYFYEMPYGEHYIWGLTAGIIRGWYERMLEHGTRHSA